jgi:hypothetical protein
MLDLGAKYNFGVTRVLASPEFWPDLRSGGEPECLQLIGILSFDDEFREAVA